MRARKLGLFVLVAAGLAFAVVATMRDPADAADHLDPSPRVAAGDSTDIADIYAWHQGGNLVVALTFAGPVAPGVGATYDRDALYGIHIDDADADNLANDDIYVRFGQNMAGEWGVWADGVPGGGGAIVGPAGGTITSGPVQVYTGLRDDPFFFDLQGFQETLAMGTLRFDGTRDFFAGQNVTAIVVEFPLSELSGTGPFNVWATTASRAGGAS
ncbi:MAG: DUF4331 family protein [Myxococcota bacterium]